MKTNENTYFLTLENHTKKGAKRIERLEWHYYPYDDDFRALQKQVGGTFQHFDIFPPFTMQWEDVHKYSHIDSWINDEGKLIGLMPTIPVLNENDEMIDFVVGNICFLRSDEYGNSYGLNLSEMLTVMRAFHFYYQTKFRLPVYDYTGFTGNYGAKE